MGFLLLACVWIVGAFGGAMVACMGIAIARESGSRIHLWWVFNGALIFCAAMIIVVAFLPAAGKI